MKRRRAVGVAVAVVVCCSALVFAVLKLTVWSGPSVIITSKGASAKIDSTFLGEYYLGMTRLRIEHRRSRASIVDVSDPGAGIPNIFMLHVGRNEVAVGSGPPAYFELLADEPYRLTLCGNNGFARVLCTSKSIELTVQ